MIEKLNQNIMELNALVELYSELEARSFRSQPEAALVQSELGMIKERIFNVLLETKKIVKEEESLVEDEEREALNY